MIPHEDNQQPTIVDNQNPNMLQIIVYDPNNIALRLLAAARKTNDALAIGNANEDENNTTPTDDELLPGANGTAVATALLVLRTFRNNGNQDDRNMATACNNARLQVLALPNSTVNHHPKTTVNWVFNVLGIANIKTFGEARTLIPIAQSILNNQKMWFDYAHEKQKKVMKLANESTKKRKQYETSKTYYATNGHRQSRRTRIEPGI